MGALDVTLVASRRVLLMSVMHLFVKRREATVDDVERVLASFHVIQGVSVWIVVVGRQ